MLFTDCLLHALEDTARLLPFLFLTYLVMEYLEQRAGERSARAVRRTGRLGPLAGAALGAVPQCGFSAAASSLYSGGLITAGTLMAVFLSTSDEMLPIFYLRDAALDCLRGSEPGNHSEDPGNQGGPWEPSPAFCWIF